MYLCGVHAEVFGLLQEFGYVRDAVFGSWRNNNGNIFDMFERETRLLKFSATREKWR